MSRDTWLWSTVGLILVLIVVAFGMYFLISRMVSPDPKIVDNSNTEGAVSNTTPVSSNSLPRDEYGNAIVRYTSAGFIPQYLSIAKGEAVTFRNDADASLQISPADQTNEPYVQFDQTAHSLGMGDSFSYTFAIGGSYTYYNENSKSDTGVITAK